MIFCERMLYAKKWSCKFYQKTKNETIRTIQLFSVLDAKLHLAWNAQCAEKCSNLWKKLSDLQSIESTIVMTWKKLREFSTWRMWNLTCYFLSIFIVYYIKLNVLILQC